VILVGVAIAVARVGLLGTSRYPELDEKATMGGDANLEDPLSFESRAQLQRSHS
jgi:hypothetical protein